MEHRAGAIDAAGFRGDVQLDEIHAGRLLGEVVQVLQQALVGRLDREDSLRRRQVHGDRHDLEAAFGQGAGKGRTSLGIHVEHERDALLAELLGPVGQPGRTHQQALLFLSQCLERLRRVGGIQLAVHLLDLAGKPLDAPVDQGGLRWAPSRRVML